MIDLKSLNSLTIDYGNYFSFAERLSREDGFGKSYYAMPYVHNGFPDHRPLDIGRNVSNVICVKEWAECIHDVDIVCFPDSHEPALQEYFISIGKRVFGCRRACELEHNKGLLKQTMKEIGLPVSTYYSLKGVDELEEFLKYKENVYVKSELRGDMETWKHRNYALSKLELVRMKNHMGAFASKENYIVEEPVDSIAEIGIDSFCVDGKFPKEVLTGIELKDTGYCGCFAEYDKLPIQLKEVTDKFSDLFGELNYRGAHSNEIIVGTDKRGYCIDLTQRIPNPPGELYLELYSNFPEIVWLVANGIIPTVEYRYKWGVQLIIKSDTAKTDPSPIIVPEEYKQAVKLKYLVIDDDGTWYYVPPVGLEMREIGSVSGYGNTMKEAINMAKKIAESIEGFDIEINSDCLEKAQEQIANLKKAGINYLT